MAHDVSFYNAENEKDEAFFFFGYLLGIFYKTFQAEHLNAGCSGNGGGVERSREHVLEGITNIQKLHPQNEQINELYSHLHACNYQVFLIEYG